MTRPVVRGHLSVRDGVMCRVLALVGQLTRRSPTIRNDATLRDTKCEQAQSRSDEESSQPIDSPILVCTSEGPRISRNNKDT
jgi:hypothetical protein